VNVGVVGAVMYAAMNSTSIIVAFPSVDIVVNLNSSLYI